MQESDCHAGPRGSVGRKPPVKADEPTHHCENLAGRTRPSVVLFPGRCSRWAEHWAATIVAEQEWLLYPSGLPGTAGRGLACSVVWEAGREIPPPTRLALLLERDLRIGPRGELWERYPVRDEQVQKLRAIHEDYVPSLGCVQSLAQPMLGLLGDLTPGNDVDVIQ